MWGYTIFTSFSYILIHHLKKLRPKCLKPQGLTNGNVCLKKNLKMLRHITFLVSRPIWTYELIASSLIEGGISWSCHPRCSHKGAILLLRHMCT
jgi:hypothetical protein